MLVATLQYFQPHISYPNLVNLYRDIIVHKESFWFCTFYTKNLHFK